MFYLGIRVGHHMIIARFKSPFSIHEIAICGKSFYSNDIVITILYNVKPLPVDISDARRITQKFIVQRM